MDARLIIFTFVCIAVALSSSTTAPDQQSTPTPTKAGNGTSNATAVPNANTQTDTNSVSTSSQDRVVDPDTFYSWFKNGMKPETNKQKVENIETETPRTATEDSLTTDATIESTIKDKLMNPDEFYAWFENKQFNSGSHRNSLNRDDLSTPDTDLTSEGRPSLPSEVTPVTAYDNEMNQEENEASTVVHEEVSTVSSAEIEMMKEMFQDNFKTISPLQNTVSEHSELDSTTSASVTTRKSTSGKFGETDRSNSNIPSPDEFFGWFSKNHQSENQGKSNHRQTEKSTKLLNDNWKNSALIISACVSAGVLSVIAIVMVAFVLHKRKSKKSKIPEDNRMKSENPIYTNGYTDVFHGIPTNNDIWKNLDMLSMTAPSILPDSPPKKS